MPLAQTRKQKERTLLEDWHRLVADLEALEPPASQGEGFEDLLGEFRIFGETLEDVLGADGE